MDHLKGNILLNWYSFILQIIQLCRYRKSFGVVQPPFSSFIFFQIKSAFGSHDPQTIPMNSIISLFHIYGFTLIDPFLKPQRCAFVFFATAWATICSKCWALHNFFIVYYKNWGLSWIKTECTDITKTKISLDSSPNFATLHNYWSFAG